MPEWFLYAVVVIAGAILGSFANVCIARLPVGESVVFPRSHCPRCGHRLSMWENIPLVSYVFLSGRCRRCRKRISVQYPIVELICICLSVLTWWRFQDTLKFLIYYCLLIVPLVVVTFIDLRHRIIPDVISIPGIFVGIGARTIFAGPGGYGWAALDSVGGGLLGGLFLFMVAFVYEKLKKQEGLGGGDIKLIAMLGAFFGWRAAILILVLSSLMGSVIGLFLIVILRKDVKYAIPFGPFLSAAGLIYLFVGEGIIFWYTGLF